MKITKLNKTSQAKGQTLRDWAKSQPEDPLDATVLDNQIASPTPEQEAKSALQRALDSLDKIKAMTPEIEDLIGQLNQKTYMKKFFPKG